ncbi:MAG: hypothetical protein JWO80_3791 [Bryobacterales bacterium]|nr:hypothetical protein [Bryobacterales bacterium]
MMQVEQGSQRQIPNHPRVSCETRQAVLEERMASDLADVTRTGENAKKIGLIAGEHRERVIHSLGHDKYQKLRCYLKDQKRFKNKVFFPPRGPEMSRSEVESFHRERKEESLVWAHEAGIDIHQLQKLSRNAAALVRELAPATAYQDDKRAIIVGPANVPLDIRNHNSNPWIVVSPPFGSAWWYSGSNAGFSFSPTLYLDPSIGFIGNLNHIDDSDAGDADYGYMEYATNLYFWFQMPTAGLIEVWIEAVSRGSHHRVSLFDEWGWSDSSVNQHNYLTLNASVGGSSSELQRSETSWWTESGATEGHWDNSYIAYGDTVWGHLTSDPRTIFPAGSWVLVEVGTLNFNSALANDVSTYSDLDFAWLINHVSVHSTGA